MEGIVAVLTERLGIDKATAAGMTLQLIDAEGEWAKEQNLPEHVRYRRPSAAVLRALVRDYFARHLLRWCYCDRCARHARAQPGHVNIGAGTHAQDADAAARAGLLARRAPTAGAIG